MQKKTQDEINHQIDGLKKMKTWLPEHSAFGSNNWGQIDAQLDVLEGSKIASDFEDEEDEIFIAAQDAEDWLDGIRDEDLFEEQ